MSELVFLLSAETDIQTAYEFYDEYQSGRGEIFLWYLDAALGRLRKFPELAPSFRAAYRRLLVENFPYGIFYTLEGGRIIVMGVMDLRQSPEVIRRRLLGQ
jgi:hypothetical protein